ncbi:MAG: hypothetical protein ACTSX4_02600 [Candidatus Helarchaeota archaeon]
MSNEAINEEKLLKNKAIIIEYLKNEIEIGNSWMEEHLKSKSSIIPMDLFFKLLIGPDIAAKMKKQVDLLLDCSIEYLKSGKNPETLEKLVSENLRKYLIRDSLHQNLKKRHKSYEEIKNIIEKIFRDRIITEALIMEGDGNTYSEISTDKLKIDDSLGRFYLEKSFNEQILDIIRKNRSIINIAGVLRADLIDAFIDFYEYLHDRMEKNIRTCFKEKEQRKNL